jgi:hypothetical protein
MDFPTLGELIKYFLLGCGVIVIVFMVAVAWWDAVTERERQEELLQKIKEDLDASDDRNS